MKVYSKTVFSFLEKAQKFTKEILSNEAHIKVNKTRFEINGISYPLHLIAFTQDSKVGFFDPFTYQIGLNLNLVYTSKDSVLKDILRHEIAHYLTYVYYPNHSLPHGNEFQSICSKFNWKDKVSKASIDLEKENFNREGEFPQQKMLSKVQKLLQLSQSSNAHEAQMATLKANDLILKYNLQNINADTEEMTYVDTVIYAKRRNSKLSAIYEILKHFMVNPIFTHTKEGASIEVSGSMESLELARYVSNFLDKELERIWNTSKSDSLKGARAKNSFFLGIARGYDQKMNKHKENLTPSEQKDLIVLQSKQTEILNKIYPRLGFTTGQSRINNSAFNQGKLEGAALNVQNVIKDKLKNKLLSWRK